MDSEVQVLESSFVAPSEPAPGKGLWLSSLDLVQANKAHTPTIYLYSPGGDDAAAAAGFFDVARPKEAMAKALVTFLKCGGVALGTALHHASIDAASAFHFFQTWSAFSRHGDRAAVELPCHDRTLLRARSPPTVHPDALSTFHPDLSFSDPLGPLAFEVYTVSRDQIATLKHLCGSGGGTSTFCAVAKLVWQCACVARLLPPNSESCLAFPADIRRRTRPPLPDRYFSNAVFRLRATCAVRVIVAEELGCVAGHIRGAIGQLDDELVRSAVDYYETAEKDRRPALRGTLPQTDLNVTSWFGRAQYDADFGWGKPQFMSQAESIRGGFVYLMNKDGAADGSGGGSGDVRVLVCMEAENMKELERLLYAKL